MTQTTFAVVLLADPEQGAAVAERLFREGVEVAVAAGSDDLYRLINSRTVDLVVVEDHVPGFLSGMEILERLYSVSQLRPGAILIAARPEEWEARAALLGIGKVLRRGGDLESLVALAKSLAASSPGAQLQTVPEARRLASQFDAIPPLSPFGRMLYDCLLGEECSTDELASAVSSDPKSMAGLLRITNSAALGLKCKVTTASEAVNLLGSQRAAGYVLKSMLINSPAGSAAILPKDVCAWFRQRAVLTGCVASAFAGRLENLSRDAAYVQGVLLDIGILAMAQAYDRHYQRIFQTAQRVGPLRLEVLEQREFHLNHAHVSAAILESWGLPESFVSLSLQHYDRSFQANLAPQDERALRALRIGAAAATAVLKPMPQPAQHLSDLVREYGSELAQECQGAMNDAIAVTMEASRLYAVAVPERSRMNQLLKPQDFSPTEGCSEVSADTCRKSDRVIFTNSLRKERNISQLELKILVIDDEYQFVQLIEQYSAAVGVQTLSGRTLDDALRLAPNTQAVFCDVHLGDDDGRNVVKRLRQSGYDAPIILMSVDRTRETIEDCVGTGISDYLIKPFSPTVFLDKLQKHTGVATRRPQPRSTNNAANLATTSSGRRSPWA
jgi:HD-like signal output (HDOD) protein/DNA-binding response OmpR family regulator